MKDIKTIQAFDNPYDLLFEHDFDVDSNPDFSEYLKHAIEFDGFVCFVINFDTVLCVDDVTGDVLISMSITEFYKASVKEFQEYNESLEW